MRMRASLPCQSTSRAGGARLVLRSAMAFRPKPASLGSPQYHPAGRPYGGRRVGIGMASLPNFVHSATHGRVSPGAANLRRMTDTSGDNSRLERGVLAQPLRLERSHRIAGAGVLSAERCGEIFDLVGGHSLREVEALQFGHAYKAHDRGLSLSLDALGHDLHPEPATQRDH